MTPFGGPQVLAVTHQTPQQYQGVCERKLEVSHNYDFEHFHSVGSPVKADVGLTTPQEAAEVLTILCNLLLCVIIFYSIYYVVLCICFTAFSLQMLDGLAPFDFKTNPSWIDPNYLVLLVSREITYLIAGLLFALVVEEWVWDYAITVTIIHVTITSAVMSEFPLMLHWWAALGSGLISMICGGQSLAYYLFKDNFIYPVLDDF